MTFSPNIKNANPMEYIGIKLVYIAAFTAPIFFIPFCCSIKANNDENTPIYNNDIIAFKDTSFILYIFLSIYSAGDKIKAVKINKKVNILLGEYFFKTFFEPIIYILFDTTAPNIIKSPRFNLIDNNKEIFPLVNKSNIPLIESIIDKIFFIFIFSLKNSMLIIYTITGVVLDIIAVTADMRRKAKTANFGIIYGISVFGLAERMNVPRQEAKELIDGYFETYPQVKEYMDRSIQVARENGYVETIFHRKRFLPDINSRNAVVRGYAERNAINAPIQGSAADIIKVAMSLIYRRLQSNNLKAKMILQVHDELNFSVPEAEKEIIQKIVIEEMERAYRMLVPLKADFGWGKNWLEAH